MSMELYIEINLTCILMLGLILVKLNKNIALQTDRRLFSYALISAELLFVLDMFWGLFQGWFQNAPRVLNLLTNMLYMSVSGTLGFTWFIYTLHNICPGRLKNRLVLTLISLPMAAIIILSTASIWTKWLFFVDENNIYHRGQFYFVQVILAYAYVLVAAIFSLYKAKKEKNYIKRKRYFFLASFVIVPMICGILQIVFKGLPTLCVGITFSLLLIYISFQENQISLDPLTMLNNRNQFHIYLSNQMGLATQKGDLYLIIMDLDDFKQINDRFGHVEGDKALIQVSELLKQACGNHNCFIARYGGDEFVIVYECVSESDVHSLIAKIHKLLEKENNSGANPYNKSLSMGYAHYEDTIETIQQFIERADKRLYAAKKQRKKEKKR